jgi:ABC-type Mn2+/Zn2+ transport system ATPase subunit
MLLKSSNTKTILMTTHDKTIVKPSVDKLKVTNMEFINSQMQFAKRTKERHLNLNELLKNHFTENKANLKTSKDGN